jgi:glycosyltransferase involved in cell wall biosynthesis
MKILIISEEISNSAAGRVFQSFVASLIKRPELQLFVIANQISKSLKSRIDSEVLNKPKLSNFRFYKLLFTLFCFDVEGYSRVRKGKKVFRKISPTFNPDVILVFASGLSYNSIDLGVKLSRKYNKPLAVHCVDPMPAPVGWGEHPALRNAIIKYAGKRLRKADFLSYINEKMLDYQQKLLQISDKTKTTVLLNPFQYLPNNTTQNSAPKLKFLYIGSFYTKRKPDKLIESFVKFLAQNPEAELIFVGVGNNSTVIDAAKKHKQINVHAWTDEPEKFMDEATVLIDMDADIPNDVFIGSKLNNYIMYNKPILSISPIGSPSRQLLKDCQNTIFFSDWSVDSIYNNILEINNSNFSNDRFEERNYLRTQLNIENITYNLILHLNAILSKENIQ